MSLINQALKKAQDSRGTPPHAASNIPHTSPNYTPPPAKSKSALKLGLVAAFAVLIGLVAGLSVLLFGQQNTPADNIPANTADTAPPPAQVATTTTPAPPASAPETATPQPTTTANTAPRAPHNQPAAQPVELAELQSARILAENDLQTQQAQRAAQANAEQAAIAERAAIQRANEIRSWINTAKINGIKLTGSSPKVVINSKAYTIGDTLHFDLGLAIQSIEKDLIVIIDQFGHEYTKRP